MNPLYEWYEADLALKAAKEKEMELRKQVFEAYFPEPVEGTNKVEVEGGAVLIANLPYNYSLDEDGVEAGLALVPKGKQETLVVYKPTLVKKVYNGLSAKAKAAFTAECVVVKPGTPSLQIKAATDPDDDE